MVKPSFQAAPKRKCHHTFWKEILEEIQMKHCKKFFYLDPPSRTACPLEVSELCCEPTCLLVPTPGLSSSPFLEPTGLAEGTVAAWEGFYLSLHFLSLQGSLSPWDSCGGSPCPILCSASPEHLNLFHGQPKGSELLHLFCLQLFHSHGCQPG